MRDYSNMPIIKWEGASSAKKAMAQVQHAEPVIIEMPEGFIMALDADTCGCKATDDPHLHIDCSVTDTLKILADENQLQELVELAEVANAAGQVVDIDTNERRIIIHD